MLDGSEWSVLGILPNIKPSTDLEIIAGEFGIFSAESSRVGISEPELRSDWEWVLTHFQDGYGSPYFPAVTCQRTENVACGLDGIKYRDFRNAVCISCLFLVRTQRINPSGPSHSDAFNVHPVLVKEAGGFGHNSPATFGVHDIEVFRGFPSLEYFFPIEWDGALDRGTYRSLSEMQGTYESGELCGELERRLWRSIDIAFKALHVPGLYPISVTGMGSLVVLWVSAIETLTGIVNQDPSKQLLSGILAKYPWVHPAMQEKVLCGKRKVFRDSWHSAESPPSGVT